MVRQWVHLFSVLVFCATPVFAAPPFDPGIGSIDEELVRMGEEIPGFGGFFYDEQGVPNVSLTDPEGPGATVLKSLAPGEVRIRRADYEIRQLAEWRMELRPLLALPDVVLLDLDEAANRVRVGVNAKSRQKGLNRDRLERELIFRGVPRKALVVEEVEPVVVLASLRDSRNPAPGGVEIGNLSADNRLLGLCTLGFNAFRDGVFGFVTNSHCTATWGEVEGTRYSQNLDAWPLGPIATELVDPPYFEGGRCPAGRRCRYSDSSFARYDSVVRGVFKKIARTAFRGTVEGSLDIDARNPELTIAGRILSPARGQVVNKMGRTTGWTYGRIVATCVDVNAFDTNGDSGTTQLCQSVVAAGVDGGDSGSPVFVWARGANARLAGILWGGGGSPSGPVFLFSPLGNVVRELGALKVH